jgi:hypothetical protein
MSMKLKSISASATTMKWKSESQSVIKRSDTVDQLEKDESFALGLAKSRPTVRTIHDNAEKMRASAKSGNKESAIGI